MKEIKIYTDGACSGNPGPGGWGAVLQFGEHEKVLCGGALETTNNRMELSAVIEALRVLKEPCSVTLTTDSKYVSDAINKGWLPGWEKKGWKLAGGGPVKNVDLWQALQQLLAIHQVRFCWVKGHAGHPQNERCDVLAVEAIAKVRITGDFVSI